MAEIPVGPHLGNIQNNNLLNLLAPDPGSRTLDEDVDNEFVSAKRRRCDEVIARLPSSSEEKENARLIMHNVEHRLMGPAAGGK